MGFCGIVITIYVADMSNTGCSRKREPQTAGLVQTGDVSSRVQAGNVSSSVDGPAANQKARKKCRKAKVNRAIAHNFKKELDCYLECPFASSVDLTEIFDFW